jgi:hypothetical protein
MHMARTKRPNESGEKPRNLKLIVIDDSPIDYAGKYKHLDVVVFPNGRDRIGSWLGLLDLLVNDAIPEFDLLLYDICFDKDQTLVPVPSNLDVEKGDVISLGMELALAVLAGRSRKSGMPIAQSGFSAFRERIEQDRHSLHIFALLRALEGEPPAGIDAEQLARVLPDQAHRGVRRDINQLKTKSGERTNDDLSLLMPSYRKHFLAACRNTLVLDEQCLAEALEVVHGLSAADPVEIGIALDSLEIAVEHAECRESLRLRSFFADKAVLQARDLFHKPAGFDYAQLLNEVAPIDFHDLGVGDYLELLKVVTNDSRNLEPIVRKLFALIEERRSQKIEEQSMDDDTSEGSVFRDAIDTLWKDGSIGRNKISKARVATCAMMCEWLHWYHDHKRKISTRAEIDSVLLSLGATNRFARNYPNKIGYQGSLKQVLDTLRSKRLPPDFLGCALSYWDDLNKKLPKHKWPEPPPCLDLG